MPHAIEISNVSKQYRLGQVSGRTLAEDISRWWARTRGRPDPYQKVHQVAATADSPEYMWALRGVDISVDQGEVLGVIGRNGAGKSTLLKILSRITAPTSGEARIRGRLASLLEVGTGFHPELTGRENIFLNGTVMGLTKREVADRLEEIIEFSEVRQFIDTPVKRYSSGMYVRLAFSVAAHLDPAILLVDEVLAVGDLEFQRKCLGRMREVSGQGRTVLFISHNMDAVAKLCDRVVFLKNGQVAADDSDVRGVIQQYVAQGGLAATAEWHNARDEFANPWFQPIAARIRDERGRTISAEVPNDAPLFLEITGDVAELSRDLAVGYYCYGPGSNAPVYVSQHRDADPESWPRLHVGRNTLVTPLPTGLFNVGHYTLKPYVLLRTGASTKVRFVTPDEDHIVVSFDVGSVVNTSPAWIMRQGVIAPILPWEREDAPLGWDPAGRRGDAS